jgi:hypothetical protein
MKKSLCLINMNPFVDVFPPLPPPMATSTSSQPASCAADIRQDRRILQNIRSLASSARETTVLTNGMTVAEFCLRYIRLYHFRTKRPAR